MTTDTGVRVDRDSRGVATVTLDRPDARNAFHAGMMNGLRDAATGLAADADVRVVVLTGAGDIFSAGADINWMRDSADQPREANLAGARDMNAMLRAIADLPQAVVGRINGHALGGGTGLTAVCDIAVAVEGSLFGFTEVRLGLVPAVISPYVVRKIGRSHARALFVTGRRFDASEALRIGLVHRVVGSALLDTAVDEVVGDCLAGAPGAVALAKRLPELALRDLDVATDATPAWIADARAGAEGQEGLRAFMERRRPAWAPPADGR